MSTATRRYDGGLPGRTYSPRTVAGAAAAQTRRSANRRVARWRMRSVDRVVTHLAVFDDCPTDPATCGNGGHVGGRCWQVACDRLARRYGRWVPGGKLLRSAHDGYRDHGVVDCVRCLAHTAVPVPAPWRSRRRR